MKPTASQEYVRPIRPWDKLQWLTSDSVLLLVSSDGVV
jgi:hypothetical protein